MTSPQPRPETIDRLASAVYPSFAMLAGMQLDLFTPLQDGPLTGEQIADALKVRPDKLSPLLYALVAAGLLTVDGELFSNTPESDQFLVRGKASYRGGTHGNVRRRWERVLQTAETIRTGVPQGRIDFSTMPPDQMESLARGRQTETTAAAQELMARYDFSSYRDLLDVGGAPGYLSVAVTEAFPQLRATVVDLPTVTPIAQRVVAEMEAADRVQVVTADVVNGPMSGAFDVAVMKHFIQVLSAEQARRAVCNVGEAVEKGSVIYVMGTVIDDSRTSPLETVGFNLMFLNTYDEGQVYTEREHREWLAEAGFSEGFERVILPSGDSIIRAKKPA